MSNDIKREYDELRKRAVSIESMYRNMLDDRDHRVSREVWSEFTELIVDIRQIKHPRTIEQRVERIQRHLTSVRDGDVQIMRIDENVTLHDHCERFRRDLRKLSNYQ